MSTMPIVAFLYHQSNLSDKMCDSKSLLKMEEEDMKEHIDEDPLVDALSGMHDLNSFIKEEDIKKECNEQDLLAVQGGKFVLFLSKK